MAEIRLVDILTFKNSFNFILCEIEMNGKISAVCFRSKREVHFIIDASKTLVSRMRKEKNFERRIFFVSSRQNHVTLKMQYALDKDFKRELSKHEKNLRTRFTIKEIRVKNA